MLTFHTRRYHARARTRRLRRDADPGADGLGPPRDRDAALAVVREAVRMGINHIDTSDYYGPHVANEIIREAIYPYPEDLTIVTKVGARREADKSWLPALLPKELISAVHDNLRNLRLDALDIVNLRLGGVSSGRTIARLRNRSAHCSIFKRKALSNTSA